MTGSLYHGSWDEKNVLQFCVLASGYASVLSLPVKPWQEIEVLRITVNAQRVVVLRGFKLQGLIPAMIATFSPSSSADRQIQAYPLTNLSAPTSTGFQPACVCHHSHGRRSSATSTSSYRNYSTKSYLVIDKSISQLDSIKVGSDRTHLPKAPYHCRQTSCLPFGDCRRRAPTSGYQYGC